ncbi:hypothetical protein FEM48_Zijuj01G0068400 [Ziziphus jujuba var. spinosa]|uniref:LOB domain-containing protein n=1 Tax=Ziziphus jujuba var. spinosa TaxID=714518 RepID=A0A978VZR4_ZIZJJ|nr:hypothetical protein FEM48_Zijuj01G0068400 [Ziziphus jujuba var. spinosa]
MKTLQKCTQECVFAPYFPPDQPQKFANVHRVYGASNVGKLLNKLNTVHREDAVTSLAYEAEARLRDPVYGCVGFISILQNRLRQVQSDLYAAKKELAAYIGPQAMMIQPQHQPQYAAAADYNINMPIPMPMPAPMPMLGIPTGLSQGGGDLVIREPQQHQHQQQMYEVHQEQEVVRFDHDQMMMNISMSPSLGLGSTFDQNAYHIQQHPQQPPAAHYHHLHHPTDQYQQLQPQVLLHQPQQAQHSHHKSSEQG